MTNNHSSNNDDSLLNTNSDKSVPSDSSKIEKSSNEDEITAIINELLDNTYPEKQRSSKKISRWKIIRWSIITLRNLQQGLVFGYLFFLILSLLLLALSVEYQLSGSWQDLALILLGFTVLLFFLSMIVGIVSNWRTPRETTEQRLNKIRNEFISDQKKVERLYNLASQEKLKSFEIDLEKTIREAQTREKFNSSISLIVSILIVVLSIHILNIQPQYLENNLLKASALGMPGAVTLIAITLNFRNAVNLKSEINELGQCLALIKKAQIKKDKVETYKNLVQPEQSGKKQSLLSKLKQIKIDGPEDFAENLDLYLSGEKRIEPDIR